MAYSTKNREQALDYSSRGYTDEQISDMLDVSKYTVGNWKKLLFTTGSLHKKKVKRKSGKPYKYTPEKIKALLDNDKMKRDSAASSKKDGAAVAIIPKKKKKNKKKKSKFLSDI